ncbi:MAG: hypothetical protein AAF662_13290 [Pseudomonadota bacterium]
MGEFFRASWCLGLPSLLLTWWLCHRLYRRGLVAPDTGADELGRKTGEVQPSSSHIGFIQSKWTMLGGGFYGVAALWTLFIIETQQTWKFLVESARELLRGRAPFPLEPVSIATDLLRNQIQSIVDAATWFLYWSSRSSNIWIWFVVAYGAFRIGVLLASKTAADRAP